MSEQTTSKQNTGQIFTRTQIIAILFCAFVAFSLGCIGFYQVSVQAHINVSIFDIFYNSASLFFFQFYGESGNVPISLEISRWLAPFSLSYAAIKTVLAILGEKVDRVKVRWLSGHAIVFGLNERSKNTVQSLLNDGIPVVCIDESASLHNWLKKRGGHFLPKFAETKELLEYCNILEAQYLLAATGDDRNNIEIVHSTHLKRLDNPQASMLLSAVEIRNPTLASAVYGLPSLAEDYDSFTARVIHYSAMNSRLLLSNHGPHREIRHLWEREHPLNLMLIGRSELMEALVFRLAAIGYYGSPHPHHVCLVGQDANRWRERMQKENSAISELLHIQSQETDLSLLNINNGKRLLDEFSPDMIYLSADRLDSALIWTQTLNKLEVKVPIIIISADGTARSILEPLFPAKRTVKFVQQDELCSHYKNIFNIKHDKLAKAIHDSYVEKQLSEGDSPEDNPSLVTWPKLPENLKDSNRNQADHAEIKCYLLSGKDDCTAEEIRSKLTPETVEWLAKMEHERWCAEKRLNGWRYTDGAKNNDLLLNPNLVPWDQLKEEERQKDRDAVEHLPELVKLKFAHKSKL